MPVRLLPVGGLRPPGGALPVRGLHLLDTWIRSCLRQEPQKTDARTASTRGIVRLRRGLPGYIPDQTTGSGLFQSLL